MIETRANSGRKSWRRVLGVLVFVGVLIVLSWMTLRAGTRKVQAAGDVRRDLAAVVTEGGYIGVFFMRGERYDLAEGEFHNFTAETDDLMLSAKRARVRIDAQNDAISFELFEVVVMRVPEGDTGMDVTFQRLDRYELGPFPYKLDIVER